MIETARLRFKRRPLTEERGFHGVLTHSLAVSIVHSLRVNGQPTERCLAHLGTVKELSKP